MWPTGERFISKRIFLATLVLSTMDWSGARINSAERCLVGFPPRRFHRHFPGDLPDRSPGISSSLNLRTYRKPRHRTILSLSFSRMQSQSERRIAVSDLRRLNQNPIRYVRQRSKGNFQPIIITIAQVFATFNRFDGMKRTLVIVIAATALRISEVLALRCRTLISDSNAFRCDGLTYTVSSGNPSRRLPRLPFLCIQFSLSN